MKTDAIDLFGTPEPPPERRLVAAGPLTAILEDGNLRTIRHNGVEVVRAVSYLARDAAWGTFKPALSDLEIKEDERSFSIRYSGLCGPAGQGFQYRMRITGVADGTLTMEADGVAQEDFTTNRTGFVVLHPSDAAGAELVVRHTDGTEERTSFPERIMADQPAFDIAALTYKPAPGLSCTVAMEGDAFEMEDQRNWADASFKTYVRPLAKPKPYVIRRGERDRQRVVVTVKGAGARAAGSAGGEPRLTLGELSGRMPAMAAFPDEAGAGGAPLPRGMLQILVARADLSGGAEPSTLAAAGALARQAGAELAVELVMDARDVEGEAQAASRHLREAGVVPAALLVSPRREFRTRPSGTLPEGEQPADALVRALRRAGFSGRIGSGTPSYFTEFNRNPPPGDADFVFFSVAATVHAADDVSVMETLEVFPQIVESARALVPGKPVWLGPCTIGVRHNPYGADVQPNPDGVRVASARFDPRQAHLFGAAYAAGVAAQAAASGVDTLSLASLAGPFGLFNDDGSPRPIAAVQSELARAAGAECFALDGPGLRGVAYRAGRGLRGLVANTSADDVELALPEIFASVAMIERDGAASALAAAQGRLVIPAFRTAILS